MMVERSQPSIEDMIADGAQNGYPGYQTGLTYGDGYKTALLASLEASKAMCATVVEKCAKIAEPWAGFWLDENSTDAERDVVELRREIAAKIRKLAQ